MKRNPEDYPKDLLYYAEEVLKSTNKQRTLFLLQCIDEVTLKIKDHAKSN